MPPSEQRKSWDVRSPGDRLRYAAFFLAVLLILGGASFADQALRALIETGDLRDRAQATMSVADRLMLGLRRSELAARNYARTGEAAHLESYRAASRSVPQDLEELRRLVADDPEQRRRVDELEPLVTESLAIIAALARTPSTEAANAGAFNAQLRRRAALAEQISDGVARFNGAENRLYLERRAAAYGNARLAQIAVIGTTGASALALCGVLYLMTVEIRRRRTAEAELADLNRHLEERVRAQTADLSETLQTLRRETGVRHEAELRLRALQRELVRASRLTAIGQIGAMLAHEINQPLTAIINYVHGARNLLAATRPEVALRLPEALEKAEQQAVRAAQVVQRLRDYIGRRETHQAPESLPEMIEDARVLALAGAGSNEVSVRINLDPAARMVVVDRAQIMQVLVNLLRNALDAMAGSEQRELFISTALCAEGMVEIAVADSGAGLPDEVRQKLFTPFVTTKEDGLGIGLSTCQAIVEAHGGRIDAQSRPGGGTVFRFTLHSESPRTPLSTPEEPEESAAREA